MPSKNPLKFYQLLLKTHKLTILLTASQSATVASLKQDALSALMSDVNQMNDVPKVTSEDDFEICKLKKDKGRRNIREYEVLDGSLTVKTHLANWENLFLQFRDESGELMPVEFTQPSLTYDDDEEPRHSALGTSPTTSKGKRKASPE